MGCGSDGGAVDAAKQPVVVAVDASVAPARPAPPPARIGARVLVDVSASVSGFFKAGARTGNAALHAELDTAIAAVGLGTPQRCTVGATVDCKAAPQPAIAFGNPVLYRESVARLDRVFARQPIPVQIDPNHPPEPDLLDDAKLTIVVTDGMQAAGPGAGNTPCARSADPSCIRSLLRERIAEGFGVWIVGIQLAFDGTHYAERALADSYLAEIKSHVDALKFDPRNLGVTFALKSKLVLGRDGTHAYEYQGRKPLLLFVLARDHELGRRTSSLLVAALRKAPLRPGKMTADETVQEIELAPLATRTVRPTAVAAVDAAAQIAEGIKAAQLLSNINFNSCFFSKCFSCRYTFNKC